MLLMGSLVRSMRSAGLGMRTTRRGEAKAFIFHGGILAATIVSKGKERRCWCRGGACEHLVP